MQRTDKKPREEWKKILRAVAREIDDARQGGQIARDSIERLSLNRKQLIRLGDVTSWRDRHKAEAEFSTAFCQFN